MASGADQRVSLHGRHTDESVKLEKRRKPYRSNWRFGVVNHLGDIWSPETFNTAEQAEAYLTAAKCQNPTWDLRRHRIVPVKVTVSVSNRKDGSSQNIPPQDQGEGT